MNIVSFCQKKIVY